MKSSDSVWKKTERRNIAMSYVLADAILLSKEFIHQIQYIEFSIS